MAATSRAIRTARRSRWLHATVDDAVVRELQSALKIGAPAARVLCARGITSEGDARRMLAPSIEHLHDPYLMRDMPAAAARLARAVRERERILLYGDYDVDGTTSIAVLKKAIEVAGGAAEYHVPHRLRDGYGMRPEVVERAAAEGVRLIVSVDTGIRAAEVVAHGNALGIETIVTDHHLPDEELPRAVAVLNPNRRDCEYPEKSLCGAGVTLKLVQALMRELEFPPERQRRLLESFLKIVAIATIADVVPLTGENRVIVRCGLTGLRDVRNPGLRALLEIAGFQPGDTPSAGQVAFRVAPRINAAGRMSSATEAVELLLTNDGARAKELAASLHQWNTDRQQTEAEIVEAVLKECDTSPVTDADAGLVFAGEGWHRGVLGIVASRLVERFCRPVFVLSRDAGANELQGSGRSVPSFHLLQALESMAGLFVKFGGHRQAAGLTIEAEKLDEFRRGFSAYAATILSPADFCPCLEVDAPLDFTELDDRSAAEVLQLAPFGCGNPAPVFAVRGAEIRDSMALQGGHARLRIAQGSRAFNVKAWNFAECLASFPNGSRVDAAIAIDEDAYSAARGYPGWCLTLRDVRI